jgi:hypothetical protein
MWEITENGESEMGERRRRERRKARTLKRWHEIKRNSRGMR